jgi:hypothetical protein
VKKQHTWLKKVAVISLIAFSAAPAGMMVTHVLAEGQTTLSPKQSTPAADGRNQRKEHTSSGKYTPLQQQLVTSQYYAGSLVTTPLPADVDRHRAINSDAIISNVYFPGAHLNVTALYDLPTSGTAASQMAFYYSDASDPIYKVLPSACTYAPSDSKYNPVGKYFHLTKQALPSNTNGDSFMLLWDQSSDIDKTPGGRILSFYNPHTSLPNCSCSTKACADATPACQISSALGSGWGRYCEVGFPNETVVQGRDKSSGGYGSLHFQAGAGFLRDREIINGSVSHALILNTYCVSPPAVVFPATGYGANLCSNAKPRPPDLNNHPHVGSLIYIDRGYNCDSLPHWQRGVCHALQTYGGYVSDTGGYDGIFGIVRAEGGMGYSVAGLPWPFLDYIKGQSGNGLQLRGSPVNGANLPFFNMSGVQSHLHVADPCITKRMAGVPGGC